MFAWVHRVLGAGSDVSTPRPLETHTKRNTAEEVYLDAAARFLDVQVSTMDVLDNKAANAFSVGSVVLPVTFGLLSLSSRKAPTATVVILVLALLAYVVLVILVWRVSRNRILEYRPDLSPLGEYSKLVSVHELQRWVADQYVTSTELNEITLARKGIWVGRAITALYAEGFLLSLAAVSTLL